MLHKIPNGDGTFTIVDEGDADDLPASLRPPASSGAIGRGATPSGTAASGTSASAGGTSTGGAALASETITHSGGGLVFNNTYGSGVTTTFRNEIVAAESYLQSQFTNSVTVNCSFDLQSLNPSFSGENSFNVVSVSYATLVNALASHVTSTEQAAAVASLQHLSDPSHGAGFIIPDGEARILGLAGGPSGGTIDDAVVLNSVYWTSSALQNNPGDAEGVLEHELSEGAMGRIGSLGIANSSWAPMDLFRFTASGQRDFTGGHDGQPTYFSADGTNINTGLQYHSSVNTSGQFDGFDFADWDQVGQDANARDPFGPGGPGAGDPGTLSATDLQIMNVLGWNTSSQVQAPVVTSNNQSVATGAQVALSNLFNITGSGITQYKVWFSYPEGGAPALGTLTNGGTSIALDQPVTLSSLNGWVYTGPAAHGTDKIWLDAYNGSWSNGGNWVETDIADPGSSVSAPVVTSNNQSVATGAQVALSNLFNITGSGITQYKVWFSYPEGGAPALGTLTNGGTSIALDQPVTLSSLNGWVYTGPAAHGTDKIWLDAYNGSWSNGGNWVETDIADPGNVVCAPVVTSNNQSVATGVQVALSNLFNITGSGITQYKVWFSYPEGGAPALGTLTNGGTSIALDQPVTLSSLNGWVYTGPAAHGTDKIWLDAYNGSWSNGGNWVETDIADPGSSVSAPVVTSNNQSVATGVQVALSNLFNITGSGITQYKVWFSYPEGGAPALGTLTNGGTSIALDQPVTLSSLNGWVYTGPAAHGTDKIWLDAYNGSWSNGGNWVETDIADPGSSVPAPVVTSHNQTVGAGQSVALSSLFNISGSGITQYKVWFSYPEGGAPAHGTLTNGGTSIALDQPVTLSSLNGWVYTGPATTGTDKIWLEAYNGSWSNGGNWVETDINGSGAATFASLGDDSASLAPGGGQLVFSDTASQGAGSVVIAAGSSVELTYSAAPVSFIASTGTLQIDNSARFTGQISGFAGQDQIDLRDIVFNPQTTLGYAANSGNTGGTLMVSNGRDSAGIALLGGYTAAQFVVSSDDHGGTLVTAQQTSPIAQTSLGTPHART